MRSFQVWIVAVLVYAGFLGWYENWQGPMTRDEVDAAMLRIAEANGEALDSERLASVRAFLAADDGREFLMLNLLTLSDAPIIDPDTGAMQSAEATLAGYTAHFMPALFARAGHPALIARKVAPYVEAWRVEADPGWSFAGFVRYRSRRDMAELVSDPRFSGAHAFKVAALAHTLAFPSQPVIAAFVSPRVTVALGLALLAAFAQIVWLLRLQRTA